MPRKNVENWWLTGISWGFSWDLRMIYRDFMRIQWDSMELPWGFFNGNFMGDFWPTSGCSWGYTTTYSWNCTSVSIFQWYSQLKYILCMWCDVMWNIIMFCYVMSCHIMSYIMSFHDILCYFIIFHYSQHFASAGPGGSSCSSRRGVGFCWGTFGALVS